MTDEALRKRLLDPTLDRFLLTRDEAEQLLAEPRLPAEPSREVLDAMLTALREQGYAWLADSDHYAKTCYRVVYKELTRPKTKTVWRLVWTYENGDKSGEASLTEETYGEAVKALLLLGCGDNHIVSATIAKVEIPA